jgi:hypothetical protein
VDAVQLDEVDVEEVQPAEQVHGVEGDQLVGPSIKVGGKVLTKYRLKIIYTKYDLH